MKNNTIHQKATNTLQVRQAESGIPFFFLFFPVFLSIFFLSGCVNLKQPANKISYYTLEYESPQFPEATQLPVTITVERFSVAPSYNSEQMIYRDKSYTRNAYTYHKWHANPGRLVHYYLKRDLTESGLFMAVFSANSRLHSPFTLQSSVDEVLELDNGENWSALLTISVTLMAADEPDVSRQILFQKKFTTERPCRYQTPQAFAKAMSEAMAQLSKEIITAVHDTLSKKKHALSVGTQPDEQKKQSNKKFSLSTTATPLAGTSKILLSRKVLLSGLQMTARNVSMP